MLNIDELQSILPQRFPFLMIDRVVELEPGKKVVAVKNVSINEQFFSGHFPGRPIMPGVLIIEAMAQAAIVLFAQSKDVPKDKKMAYYLGNVKVRFFSPVFPGDQLKIKVEPLKMLSAAAIVSVEGTVGDRKIAEGELALSAKES